MIGSRRNMIRRERQPLPRPIGFELSYVKDAVVQRADPAGARQAPGQIRDVSIDILVALVVTCVDDYLALFGFLNPCAFVFDTAESGPLDRHRLWSEGVDLHNPAEPIRFVSISIGIEPG